MPAFAAEASLTTDSSATQLRTITTPIVVSDAEGDALQFMREEEKLAHDVYVTLAEQWGLRVFTNISASEQQHSDAVATLLGRAGLSDPVTGNAVGEFTDPVLQKLYNDLIVQGSKSVADALKVGAAIEEIDIADLQERMAGTTNADILRVYGNLLKGSENHLRSFASTLENQTGEKYVPQYMDQTAYDAILAAAGSGQNSAGGRGGNSRRP
ncbi:MAG: DUF2202 domain-containing protein [Anaerolineales bacterium]|nr:DUF2202 domain-containing protein [Anaerolineales bacterium]